MSVMPSLKFLSLFLRRIGTYNNNNKNFFILQNGSASTRVKAAINPCVAYKKCSITSISMNKIRLLEKKSTLKLS